MIHREDEILISQELQTAAFRYVWEEYWEEDDAGYCVSDYILSKHTRLSVYAPDGSLARRFDFDGREYDKSMELTEEGVMVIWHPSFDETRRVCITEPELVPTEMPVC